MDALNWRLFFVWLCFNEVQTEASSWTINLPSTVKGHIGSCVVIPCSFSYPDNDEKVTEFTGIWIEAPKLVVYHPVKSNIVQQYRDRTELLGDIKHKNCSLKINPLQQSDQGPFYFRIEIAHFENFSYKAHEVSIIMMGKVDVDISLTEDAVEGQLVVAYCSVSPSCPTSIPVFRWSHSGEEHFHSLQFDDDQWKATATLTFRPTNADHNKSLRCNAQYSGGQQWETSKLLKVKQKTWTTMWCQDLIIMSTILCMTTWRLNGMMLSTPTCNIAELGAAAVPLCGDGGQDNRKEK